jgi:UPF0755 protein
MRWLLAVALILIAAGGGGAFYAYRLFDQPGPLPVAIAVPVPRGGSEAVALALHDAGVIDKVLPFRVAAFVTRGHGPLRAAEFAFPAHGSLRQVLAVLRSAKPVIHRLTIPEGLTAKQIASLLAAAETATGQVDTPAEGSLLPRTYEYEYGTPRTALAARAQAAMDRALDEAWTSRAPALPLASPRDALILASIVERETARPEERPLVAAVYLNRLRRGMRLQADPTVAYAASGGGTLDHALTRADLDRADPFNTYRNLGLPPGPICSPGLASLHAVLQPAQTDDLYFVADGTGGHAFARTLDEHARNVARRRAATASPPPATSHCDAASMSACPAR